MTKADKITLEDFNEVKERVLDGISDALDSIEPLEVAKLAYDDFEKLKEREGERIMQTAPLIKKHLLDMLEERITLTLKDMDLGAFIKEYR